MILQFFAAFIGAAGFGFLFHLQFKHIFPAALGGVLTWVIYVIATTWGFDVFISSLFASAFAAIYSEVIAKIRKAPTTLFLIISVVVLIPGGSLLHDELCCSEKMGRSSSLRLPNITVCFRTCHWNEPHLDIPRYGKKGVLFNSLRDRRPRRDKMVCIPSSRQLKKYKIFVLPGVYWATFLCRQSLLFMKFHWC